VKDNVALAADNQSINFCIIFALNEFKTKAITYRDAQHRMTINVKLIT